MSRLAWAYLWLVLLAGLGFSVAAIVGDQRAGAQWTAFAVLVLLATGAQIYGALGPNHEVFHATPVFLFAGALLLPPLPFVLLVLIAHLVEWGWVYRRPEGHLRAWYIQPFNIAKHLIAGLCSQLLLAELAACLPVSYSPVVPVIAAILAYAAGNQVILGLILILARGVSWSESKVLSGGLLTELILACLGYTAFLLWQHDALLLPLVLAPLALIYKSFSIPRWQAEHMRNLQRINDELSQANLQIGQLNDELFRTLAMVFDARDPYVGGHAAQVAAYAVAIATELGLPPERVEVIRRAGYLHDIGKIAIPESVLHKRGKLTEDEYEIIKTHASRGADLLQSSQGLSYLAPFVRYHHERWDGKGYPEQLQGEQIPLEARILNVCDSVEAMASDRPYHTGMSVDQIVAELRRCSGTQFDPRLVEIFVSIAERDATRFIVNSAREVEVKQHELIAAAWPTSAALLAGVYQTAP